MKTIKYKGAIYVQAGASKGIFNEAKKAWEWARTQLELGRKVYWEATVGT